MSGARLIVTAPTTGISPAVSARWRERQTSPTSPSATVAKPIRRVSCMARVVMRTRRAMCVPRDLRTRRELDDERRAAAGLALDRDVATVRLDHLAHDPQPEPEATDLPVGHR